MLIKVASLGAAIRILPGMLRRLPGYTVRVGGQEQVGRGGTSAVAPALCRSDDASQRTLGIQPVTESIPL